MGRVAVTDAIAAIPPGDSLQRRPGQRRRAGDERNRGVASNDHFGVVVVSAPGSEIDVGPEVDLIKGALLYGDKVTVMSPLLTMLLRVEGLRDLKPNQVMALARRVAPYILPDDEAATLQHGLAEIESFLARLGSGRSPATRVLRGELDRRLESTRAMLAEGVNNLAECSGVTQLAGATSAGLLSIQSVDPGDAVDLIASCVIGAKLAERGELEEAPHSTQLVRTYVDRLGEHLRSGRDYLIFDRRTASLVDVGLKDGLFTTTPGPSARAAQAMTASGLLARLPTFPRASLDEVVDMRSEFAGPLTRFRASMVTAAKGFSVDAWDSSFADEVHEFWVETVAPAVQEINDGVRSDKSLTELAVGIVGTAKSAWPGLALVGAGLAGHAEAITVSGAAIGGVAPIVDALRDRNHRAGELRMKPFYFLYEVDTALA
jgi:hypothetical protein